MSPPRRAKKGKRRRAQGNAESARSHFTSPDFLRGLNEKATQAYYMAALYKQGGGRFRKNITSDRIFKAIEHCQVWYRRIQYFDGLTPEDLMAHIGGNDLTDTAKSALRETNGRTLMNLRQWARSNYDPRQEALLANEFITAAKSGDIERLKTLVKLCALDKTKALQLPAKTKRYPIPWHSYVAVNARSLLIGGTIPTKKQVKEAAIQHRAVDELRREQPDSIDHDVPSRIRKLNKEEHPNWPRIFKDLGLQGLPRASTHP